MDKLLKSINKKILMGVLGICSFASAVQVPTCEMEIQKAIRPYAPVEPRGDCGYAIDYMIAFQKVPGGYLATTDPEYGPDVSQDFIFIKTRADLAPHERLSGNVAYGEVFSYTALDGFKRNVYGFMAVPVPSGDPRASVPAVEPEVVKAIASAKVAP